MSPEYVAFEQMAQVQAACDKCGASLVPNAAYCERCGERPPTEPHHLKYPPWGTFDVPENLLVVCHPCHCALHGKER